MTPVATATITSSSTTFERKSFSANRPVSTPPGLASTTWAPRVWTSSPNPVLMCADLACRTSRIRLGQGANLLPYWHPIRLAEDIAMLDQMTKGRIDVAIGRGVRSREGSVFHPKSDPANPEANRELFEESLDILINSWTNEFFSHQGPNYTPPRPRHPLEPSPQPP